jgi:cobalt/nickel transport system ATP-binding protein
MDPAILVMDEPTAALDPLARRQLINLLHTFCHTKIIATHDLDMVLDLCKRTIVLHNGSILADGPTLEIFRDKDILEQAGLEQPFSMQNCPVCSKI